MSECQIRVAVAPTHLSLTRLKKLLSRNDGYLFSFYNYVRKFDLLDQISNYAVIAGSSLLYGLMPDIHKFNDIDLFFLDDLQYQTNFSNVVDLITQYYGLSRCKFILKGNSDYDDVKLMEIHINGTDIVWQFIKTDKPDPIDIINSFDLDYAYLYYYKQQLYISEIAQNAIQNKMITLFEARIKTSRLQKAKDKGFRLSPALEFILENGVVDSFTHTCETIEHEQFCSDKLQTFERLPANLNDKIICQLIVRSYPNNNICRFKAQPKAISNYLYTV